jgi:hypothetical protein
VADGSYGLNLAQPPAGEPVALNEAKNFVKVDADFNDDDALILGLIRTARRLCELHTGRQFVSATWRHTLDYFPGYLAGSPSTYTAWREWPAYGDIIRLPKPPCQAVLQITYLDTTGTLRFLDPSLYQVNTDSEPCRIRPAYGQVWPVARAQLGAVNTLYQAGYGPVTSLTAAVPTSAAAATTTVAGAIVVPGVVTVVPASMAGIGVGVLLAIDAAGTPETVTVTATTPTTFTATFAAAHLAGFTVQTLTNAIGTAVTIVGPQIVTPASMLGIAVGVVLNVDNGSSFEQVVVTVVTATTFAANFLKTHLAGFSIAPAGPPSPQQAATPASMNGIYSGTVLNVDSGSNREQVTVSATTPTTFTAPFTLPHAAGATIGPGLPPTVTDALLRAVGYFYANREGGPEVQDGLPAVTKILLDGEWYGEYA